MSRWSDALLVGHPEIDEQHRQFVTLLDYYEDAVAQDRGRAAQVRVMRALVSYAEYHFAEEEALMAQAAYPGRGAHVLAHQGFLKHVVSTLSTLYDGGGDAPETQVEFMIDWLRRHIATEDRRLVACLPVS